MSEQPFRWGILSTGGIAQQFTRDVQRLADHKVVAVGSRTQAKADEFGDMFAADNESFKFDKFYAACTKTELQELELMQSGTRYNKNL